MGFERAAQILRGDSEYYPLISSTLDVDKMDYMRRDSYFCGVNYGLVEVDYILNRMYIKKNKLVIKPVSYTHLRAHETLMNLVCRLLLEKRLASRVV